MSPGRVNLDALPPIRVVLTHYPDGSLSVEGPQDKAYLLAVLENAKDAVRNMSKPAGSVIVPGKDVSIELPAG